MCPLQEEQLGSQVEVLTLRHLDLSAVGIRDLGSVFAASGPLTALTGLNLDGNQLSSLAPLAGLSHLLALSICNNRCVFCASVMLSVMNAVRLFVPVSDCKQAVGFMFVDGIS